MWVVVSTSLWALLRGISAPHFLLRPHHRAAGAGHWPSKHRKARRRSSSGWTWSRASGRTSPLCLPVVVVRWRSHNNYVISVEQNVDEIRADAHTEGRRFNVLDEAFQVCRKKPWRKRAALYNTQACLEQSRATLLRHFHCHGVVVVLDEVCQYIVVDTTDQFYSENCPFECFTLDVGAAARFHLEQSCLSKREDDVTAWAVLLEPELLSTVWPDLFQIHWTLDVHRCLSLCLIRWSGVRSWCFCGLSWSLWRSC